MEYKTIDDIIDLLWKDTNLWWVFFRNYKLTIFIFSLIFITSVWLAFQFQVRSYYLIPIFFLIIAIVAVAIFHIKWHLDIFGKLPEAIMNEKRFEATVRILTLHNISSVGDIQSLRDLISNRVERISIRKRPYRSAVAMASPLIMCISGAWLAQEKVDREAFALLTAITFQLMGMYILFSPFIEIWEWIFFRQEKRGKYILQSLDDILGSKLVCKKSV